MGLGGSGKIVYQKWPDKIFPMVNFDFSRDAGGGGGPPSYGVWPL